MYPDAVDSREVGELRERPRKSRLRGRKAIVAQYKRARSQHVGLHPLPFGQLLYRVSVEIDGALCGAGLRLGESVVFHALVVQRLRDGAKPRLQINILPCEGARFSESHAAHEQEEQADEQVVFVIVPFIELGDDLLELRKRPEVHFWLRATDVTDHPRGVALCDT